MDDLTPFRCPVTLSVLLFVRDACPTTVKPRSADVFSPPARRTGDVDGTLDVPSLPQGLWRRNMILHPFAALAALDIPLARADAYCCPRGKRMDTCFAEEQGGPMERFRHVKCRFSHIPALPCHGHSHQAGNGDVTIGNSGPVPGVLCILPSPARFLP